MKITFNSILITILVLVSINAKAQDISPFSFGIKGGFNISNLSGATGDEANNHAKAGFNAGITLDVTLSANLYLMTGLELTSKGAKYDWTMDPTDAGGADAYSYTSDNDYIIDVKYKYNPIYLQVPIHLGYKIPLASSCNLVLHAGPYIAYGIGGKYNLDLSSRNSRFANLVDEIYEELKEQGMEAEGDFFRKDRFKRFDYGIGAGLGIEFKKVNIGFGYDLGLANIADYDEGKAKNRSASFTIGYKF